jgi:hypothetical protein
MIGGGMDTTTTTAEELAVVLASPARYRMYGPVLLAAKALRDMEHIGIAATAIFNPFGPTIETLSIGCFHGEWDTGQPVLIRRRLHPFSEAYIQVITEVYMQSETWRDHLAVILATFIGGNGASVASRSWAEPVLGTVPSGIVITDFGSQWTPEIRLGLAWLFQNTGDELRTETEKIRACGTNFWDQATWEMDRVRYRAATPVISAGPEAPVFAVTTKDARDISGIATVEDLNHYTEPAAFTQWWDHVAPVQYQQALHTQLPSAWHGAIGQVPGLAQLVAAGGTQGDSNAATCGGSGGNGDFDAWWKLFGVGE